MTTIPTTDRRKQNRFPSQAQGARGHFVKTVAKDAPTLIQCQVHRIPAKDARGRPWTLLSVPREGKCKWPIGEIQDNNIEVCGHPQTPGSSYCFVHLLASMPPAEARKVRG